MGFALTHQPCPECGSSDALSYNLDGSAKCFACQTFIPSTGEIVVTEKKPIVKKTLDELKSEVADSSVTSIADRKLVITTADKFNVTSTHDKVYFPYYNEDGEFVAAKVRPKKEKAFYAEGNWKEGKLFGQQAFSKGGKYVTIYEGEFDAMAGFQMTGSKWPSVSVRNGAGGALQDCKDNYEWLDSFENIVVCFDNDEPGIKATRQVAELFGSKVKQFKHLSDFKDACDYLAEGKKDQFVQQWWGSDQYVPDGIVSGTSLWELVNEPLEPAQAFYPWDGLNKITYGIRYGELVTITAGSGLGKSQLLREIIWNLLQTTDSNIGLMFLEESIRKTGLSLMSLAANVPMHLPESNVTEQERKDAFDATIGTGRVYLFNHFGSNSVENIVNRVRYMAKALNCKYIIIDHISIIVSAQESGDERKAIDEIMTKLRMLVQETNVSLIVVSHLKRPGDGRGHEEGAVTSLAQLRGSGSIAQLSDMVIGLERNGQAEDLTERNTTRVRVLKSRFSGETGPACSLLYNRETGRMFEYEPPEDVL